MEEAIINRVANSPIVSLDLADYHHKGERICIDIAPLLFQGLMLREKDIRDYASQHDWAQYAGKNIALCCSADAIVPVWAYMLLASKLAPYANMIAFGSMEALEDALFNAALQKIDLEALRDRPVVIKGCGDIPIPPSAFVAVSRLLQPVVKSLMYGEPCSTVPIYKKSTKTTQ